MKQGKNLMELAQEVMRQTENKKDYLVDTSKLEMSLGLRKNGETLSSVLTLNDGTFFGQVTESTHRQIGTYTGIPSAYYDRMREDAPELFTRNVNHWFSAKPEQRMIRTLDNNARAFLSNRYRRIDHNEILEQVIPILGNFGDNLQIMSCDVTDHHLYLKAVNKRLEREVKKGDAVQSGIVISNSETGHGSLTVQPLVLRLVCTNGMIAQDHRMRKYHTGVINQSGDDYSVYQSDTLAAADVLLMKELRDNINAAMDEARFTEIVNVMSNAAEQRISIYTDLPKLIELTTKEVGVNKGAGRGILQRLAESGDLTMYGLGNAFTRHSQDVESYEEATDLEAAGWKVMSMPHTTWNSLNRGAT